MLLSLFTPWDERLATLAWLYAACGAGLLLVTALAALASRARRHDALTVASRTV